LSTTGFHNNGVSSFYQKIFTSTFTRSSPLFDKFNFDVPGEDVGVFPVCNNNDGNGCKWYDDHQQHGPLTMTMTTTFLNGVDDDKNGIPFNKGGRMAPWREQIRP
jgi:hypothetical protein